VLAKKSRYIRPICRGYNAVFASKLPPTVDLGVFGPCVGHPDPQIRFWLAARDHIP
jgi:hypothetical protein